MLQNGKGIEPLHGTCRGAVLQCSHPPANLRRPPPHLHRRLEGLAHAGTVKLVQGGQQGLCGFCGELLFKVLLRGAVGRREDAANRRRSGKEPGRRAHELFGASMDDASTH